MDGAYPSLKTNEDHLIKHNFGCYCPNTFETANCEGITLILVGIIVRWCYLELLLYYKTLRTTRIMKVITKKKQIIVALCLSL